MDRESLWAKIPPTLDVVFVSPIPTNGSDGSNPTARLSPAQYTEAYSAAYNICMSGESKRKGVDRKGFEGFYRRIDRYLKSALDVVISRIKDDTNDGGKLLECYLDQFAAYRGALTLLCRIFAYFQRHIVNRERSCGRGWLKWGSNEDNEETPGPRPKVVVPKAFVDPRPEVLIANWGLPVGFTEAQFRAAESRAEIATEVDCIIGLEELGLKRWRTQVFDGLFDLQDGLGRGQISLAVDDLLADTKAEGIAKRTELLRRLHKSLEEVGVKSEHAFMEKMTGAMNEE